MKGIPKMISDAELQQAFRREYPDDLEYIGNAEEHLPYDFDTHIVTEKFKGHRWEDIHAEVLQECFDVASFLNPRAFQYFFPAFIRQSQVDLEKTALVVESLIRMLADA